MQCCLASVQQKGEVAKERRSFQERSRQRSDVPRTFLTIPVTLAQPKQCFVCTKFAQNKGKALFSLLVFTQLFRQEIKNVVFFAQFT